MEDGGALLDDKNTEQSEAREHAAPRHLDNLHLACVCNVHVVNAQVLTKVFLFILSIYNLAEPTIGKVSFPGCIPILERWIPARHSLDCRWIVEHETALPIAYASASALLLVCVVGVYLAFALGWDWEWRWESGVPRETG